MLFRSFPSTVTFLDVGAAASNLRLGQISGAGNTTIRNGLTLGGGLFFADPYGGFGQPGTGNVRINNDLAVVGSSFANVSYANAIAIVGRGLTAIANLALTGSPTANLLTSGQSITLNGITFTANVENQDATANIAQLHRVYLAVQPGDSI